MMMVMTMMMTKGTVMTMTPMMKSTSDGQLGSRLLPTPPAHQGSPLVHNVLFASNPTFLLFACTFLFTETFLLFFCISVFNSKPRNIVEFLHSQFCPLLLLLFFLIHWLTDDYVAESCGNKWNESKKKFTEIASFDGFTFFL